MTTSKLTPPMRRALEAAEEQFHLAAMERVTMATFIAKYDITLRSWRALERRDYVETIFHEGWHYPFITEVGRKALKEWRR